MPLKPLVWLGRSKSDLTELPRQVQRAFGYALYLAQAGGKHAQARPKPDMDLIKDRLRTAREAGEEQ
jgi:phage-related protein